MKTIFVVDDNDVNLVKAKRALEGQYHVRTMPSTERLMKVIEKKIPDLILLDVEMPEIDGFSALRKLKECEKTANIPVIFLTAYESDALEALGLTHGAVDFITKPFIASVLLLRVERHLRFGEMLNRQTVQLANVKNSLLEIYADTIEKRDYSIGRHLERISKYMKILIRAMQDNGVHAGEINNWDTETVVSAARLHDIGKIAVSDAILNKPAGLTREEFAQVRRHAMEGESIIIRFIAETEGCPYLYHAKLIAGSHHEKWNGSGYPRGLKGEDIPLAGRVMAFVDAYDALTSERPYKKPYSMSEVERIIYKNTRIQFDPAIVKVFFNVKDRFAEYVEGPVN